MNLLYIANARIPTEKAHGLQIFKTCEALSAQGEKVILVVPTRRNDLKNQDPFDFYKVTKNFEVKYLKTVDPTFLLNFPAGLYFKIQTFFFKLSLSRYLITHRDQVIYTRDQHLLSLLLKISKKVVWEVHDLPRNKSKYKHLWYKCDKIIAITQGLRDELLQHGVPTYKILVAPDAVDLRNFDISQSQEELRKKLNLPLDKNLIFYTGHLYGWKGAHVLAQAAKHLSDQELVCFLGGTDEDIKKFKAEFGVVKNIKILGRVASFEVPKYLKAADILALPNSASKKISTHYTSPMKLFEYMAAGKPIVASALPSIREILNDTNSVLVEPDDPSQLAVGIQKILENNDFSRSLGSQALVDVKKYTWEKRAENIINFIKNET